ncbi:Uncharacterized protein {ECO:0000313/EMBL:ERM12703.1} [Pantoea ananatis]|nr:hypothetical protein L585_00165 [Pantoea ananatis BRT175]PKC28519.1 hypothetical protein V462_22840 [Pantoea ananatis 15320]CRH29730.1 Uncharacterized protein {ECO:0000313/EMBL:ERM12703.1} [Pantoea ananatis]CRH34205.1 Uncharacterized protein BN1183_BA_00840 [Pantoea ananatis]CRH38722.1 Uncharacterized protein {ECO:0000313/EMBL:ERM12703.1} [Pantoea ananatis]
MRYFLLLNGCKNIYPCANSSVRHQHARLRFHSKVNHLIGILQQYFHFIEK